jgi:hypothetical protein
MVTGRAAAAEGFPLMYNDGDKLLSSGANVVLENDGSFHG